jgi:Xaa-Pro dipeptidase
MMTILASSVHLPSYRQDADPRAFACAAEKRARLRLWIEANQLSGVIISRRDNFAWLTAGGDSRVLNNSEIGFGCLVLTLDAQYLVAHTMDGRRLLEEQVRDQGYELVELRWHEMDPRAKALELAGQRAAADTNLEGALDANTTIGRLHFPLHELELSRLRWLGGQTGAILEQMSAWVQPGMSELQIARQMAVLFTQAEIDLDVLIVGSDERIFKYRHPLPTQKPLEKYLLLHPAARRWGLHANVSRSLHFGAPPEEVKKAYHAAQTIEGRILAKLSPGLRFADILEYQKAWYGELGYAGEWENHFQGGPTAYQVVDAGRCLTETTVEENQSFDWFITVAGAKVEELALLTADGVELPSAGEDWPCVQANTPSVILRLPDLYVR